MANIFTNGNSCEEQDYLTELEALGIDPVIARATLPRDSSTVKKVEKIRNWGGDHPDYCDACHGVGAYCGMCNGAFWDHKEWSQSPDGTWHPAKKTAEQWQAEIDGFKRQIGVSDLTLDQSRHLDWLIGRLLVAQGLAEFL